MLLNLYQKLKLKTEVLKREIIDDKARGRFIRPALKKLKRAVYIIFFDTIEFALIAFKKPGLMSPRGAGDGFIRFDSESFSGRYHYYTSHRTIKERVRLFVSTGFSSFVAFLLIFSIILSIAGLPSAYVEAATYNWLQTSWAGGVTANNASHTSDQTGWTQYSATSTVMSAGTELALASTSYTVTDDTALTTTGSATGGGFENGATSTALFTGGSDAVPSMTSLTAPSGTVTESSHYDIYGATYAFDGSISNALAWLSASGDINGAYIGYEFTSSKIITKYTIRGTDVVARSPQAWTFQGWNGSSWVTVDTRTSQTSWASEEKREYSFSNSTAYIKYRLYFTANNGDSYIAIREIDMFQSGVESAYTSDSWSSMTSAPANILDGGSLVYPASGDYIYGIKGNSTTFYRYSISGNSWSTMTAAPGTIFSGGSLVYPASGDYIYAFAGNITTTFYRYSISGNSWSTMTAAPGAIDDGGSLVYPGSGDYIYGFAGNGATTFYRYSISGDSWSTMTATPGTIASGGSLVYPGSGNYIYGYRGNNSVTFYRYSISGDSWSTMTAAPGAIGEGGALAYPGSGDYIYGYRGGNYTTFYRYSISGDSWSTMTAALGAIAAGGSLVYPASGNYIYGFAGSGTSFYRYTIASYSSSGTFTSATIDLGGAADFSTMTSNPTTQPTGTGMQFQVAANNDNSTWNYKDVNQEDYPSGVTVHTSYVRQSCTGYNPCYTTLSAWEAAQQRDLVASNEIEVAQIDGAWTSADTTGVTVDGWTTGSNNYIKIYTTAEARHSGKWNTGKYRLEVSDSNGIYVKENYTRIDGLQIKITATTNYRVGIYSDSFVSGGSDLRISHNIIRGVLSGAASSSSGIEVGDANSITDKIENNIVYDFINGSYVNRGIRIVQTDNAYVYNNTVYNSYRGYSFYNTSPIAKNNISYNNTDNWYEQGASWSASSANNLSGPSQTDAPGSNSRNGVTVTFTDATNSDFHLSSSDTGAKDLGTNLSADANFIVTTDIEGHLRSTGGTWDIGAHEYGATGANIPSSVDSSRYVRYRVYLSTTDTSVTPVLNDITINYAQYATSADLTSSAYNSSDSGNVIGSISWTESGVSGSQDIKFQIRTAPNNAGSPGTWSSWLGPTGTGDYYTAYAGTETINSTHRDGTSDQWVQYKVFFTSGGGATPTLSDVTVQYVINAPPEFDSTFGNSGVTASQNSGAGLVTIQYKIKDTDTNSGSITPGFITPTFEYSTDGGTNWTSIATSTYMTGDIGNVAVSQSAWNTYTAVWNAKSQTSGTYTQQAKVRVTINDNEGANNTAAQASANFTLDVKNPTLGSIPVSLRASSTPAAIILDATDNTSIQYRLGLALDGSDASWQAFASTTTISLATNPDIVYGVFRDAYGNTTATSTVTTPDSTTSLIIQDTTNTATSDYRLFLSWAAASAPSPGFSRYNIIRSTDNVTYSQIGSVASRTQNYYTDSTASYNQAYYYKVTTEDLNGNVSYVSSTVTGTADGVQNGNEPGLAPVTITAGSVASSGATTDSVTISWTNSVIATSTVAYSIGNTSYNLSQTVDTYSATPSVVLSGLTPNSTYYYRVTSRDAQGNTASSASNGGTNYSFTTLNGPSVSNVSITDVSNNSATISFGTNISAQGCVIYGTSKPPATVGNCASGYGTTGQSVTQTGLASGTRYYFHIKATPQDTGTYSISYDYNILNGVKEYYTFTTSSDSSAPTISSVSASVDDTTANITWITNEKATSQVEYGASSGNYGTITTKVATLDINHVVSLSSLLPATTYYFRVASLDASGNSASSTESSFTTSEEQIGISQRTVTTLVSTSGSPRDNSNPDIETVVSKVTEEGIVISWQTTEESDSFVEYGKTTNYEAIGFGRRRDSVYSHRVLLPLINFEPGETYHFKVSSRDRSGNTGESQDYTFSIIGDKRVELVEDALAEESQKGPVSESIKTFRNFLAAYSQNISIKSEESGSGASSEEQDIESFLKEVQDFVPPPILLSKEPDVETSANSAIIRWKTDVEANSIVDFIESERFDENNPKFDFQAGDFDEYVTDHEVKIANLKINTEYYMRIRSKNRLGAETKSDKFKVITTEEALEIMAHNVSVSETSMIIEWTTNNSSDSSVSYTPIKNGKKDVSLSKTKGDPNETLIHRILLEGLDMDMLYDLEVKSRTSDGEIALLDLGRKRTGADILPPVMSQIKVDQAVYPKLNKVQTIISWTTNEPSKSKVVYWEGVDEPQNPNIKENDEFVTKHIITLTNLKPGGVYRLKVISEDIAGQVASSKPTAILAPKQSESVTQLIIKNVEDIFNFGKSR